MSDQRSRPLSEDMAQAAGRIADVLGSDRHGSGALSPAVSDLTYRGLRHWGLTQVRLQRLALRPPALRMQALLSIEWAALAEKLREPHVVVSEAVTAASGCATSPLPAPCRAAKS